LAPTLRNDVHAMNMTLQQIGLVQSTFRNIEPMATMAAGIFYKRLFEIEPTTTALFKGDIKQQGQKFMQVLAVAVGGLSNVSTLVPMIQQLGLRHAGYGVRAEHYESVRQALLWTLALTLQDAYTEDVRSAWSTAYALLAGVMKEAAYGRP
jgi:hemoglobin-like flavoprotein